MSDLNVTREGHMSDADRLGDCLCSSKDRAVLYARAALDSTNNGVREFFLAMQGEETHNQEILFSFLHTRGHYPVHMATNERIAELRTTYQQMHDKLGLKEPATYRRYHTADPKMPPAHVQNPERFEYKDTH